jgi:hypothetical protein
VLQVSEHSDDELKREAADDHNESEKAGDHCQSVFHFFILCRWVAAYKNSMEPRRGYKDRFRFDLNRLPVLRGRDTQYLRGFSHFSTCVTCRLLLYRASALIAIDYRVKFVQCPSEVAPAAHPAARAIGVLPVLLAPDRSVAATGGC